MRLLFRSLVVFMAFVSLTHPAPRVSFTTYFGGSRQDSGSKLAIDAAGNIYLIGSTVSVELPQVNAAFAMSPPQIKLCFLSAAFSYDCSIPTGFLAGFAPSGTTLNLSGFLGGNSAVARAITTDAAGAVYVVGTTNGAGFLVKIDPKTGTLIFNTSLDGTPSAVRVDTAGQIVVAGYAADAFVVRLNAAGTAVSTITLGGSTGETVTGMALLPDGSVAVVGQTNSANAWLARVDPTGAVTAKLLLAVLAGQTGTLTVNAVASDAAGNLFLTGGNGYVWAAKIRAGETALAWFREFGGSGSEAGEDIAVDAAGRAWITGTTNSINFPVTLDAVQPFQGGGTQILIDPMSGSPSFIASTDAFVAAVKADGSGLQYASYIGGNAPDTGNGVAVDGAGNVYVTGSTRSDNLRFTRDQWQASRNASGACYSTVNVFGRPRPSFEYYPCEDAFLFQLQPDATGPLAPQVTSSGNYAALPLAPGALVSLFGVANAGSSTSVLFDGVAAPVIYAGGNQVNAVVPYGVAANPHIEVAGGGDTGWWPTAQVAPVIFSLNSTGTGGGAVLNQDLSINQPANPAAHGSIIAIYMTGAGATTPASVDGATTVPPFPQVQNTVEVWFQSASCCGYTQGTVEYAGAAPGLIAGVTQVNAKVPDQAKTGDATPLYVVIGGVASGVGITVAIR